MMERFRRSEVPEEEEDAPEAPEAAEATATAGAADFGRVFGVLEFFLSKSR